MNRLWLGAGLLFLAALWNLPAAFAASAPIRFSETDRVLVVAPHPDDETLGCGGVIQAALEAHAAVEVLYLTHGDHNEMASLFYLKKPLVVKSDFIRSGQIRMREAENAMAFLGVIKKNLIFLGYPDFGTENIWRRHWTDKNKPFRSFITRINKVPYVDDFSYGRPYRGENIAEDFEKVLLLYKPTRVFVTPPFDLNPDHRACYLYLNVALLDLGGKIPAPEVTLYLIHAHQ